MSIANVHLSIKTPLPTAGLAPSPSVLCLGHALKETMGVKLARTALELGTRSGGGTLLRGLCLSDGGDSFLEAFAEARPGSLHRVVVKGPLGDLAAADILLLRGGGEAVIELAKACGLAMVPEWRRNIMKSGSGAVGQMIAEAVNLGVKKIHIGLGGSATCDGGLGLLTALQSVFLSGTQSVGHSCAEHLDSPPPLDLLGLRRRLQEVELIAYCDVDNPLLGRQGTAAAFGGQKGASYGEIELLEETLGRWADAVERVLGVKLRDEPGAGAAGGAGFALAALGAHLVPGAKAMCELIGVPALLKEADLLVTMEGRFDATSVNGKAPWVAAKMAVEAGVRGVIMCGTAQEFAVDRAREAGIEVVEFARDLPPERRAAQSFTLLSQALAGYLDRARR